MFIYIAAFAHFPCFISGDDNTNNVHDTKTATVASVDYKVNPTIKP